MDAASPQKVAPAKTLGDTQIEDNESRLGPHLLTKESCTFGSDQAVGFDIRRLMFLTLRINSALLMQRGPRAVCLAYKNNFYDYC